jgi:hypothetical protein
LPRPTGTEISAGASPVNRDIVFALKDIAARANFIHAQMSTIGIEDMVNALCFSDGKALRAAEILQRLDHRRSRGGALPYRD